MQWPLGVEATISILLSTSTMILGGQENRRSLRGPYLSWTLAIIQIGKFKMLSWEF